MRQRLILAFVVVILAAIASMFLILRQSAAGEVRMFMARGGMMGLDRVATDLESYYARTGSWEGAGEILKSWPGGHGMMGQGMGRGMMGGGNLHLTLADAQENIVADTEETRRGRLSAAELENAIVLKDVDGRTIGYLVAEGVVIEDPTAGQELLNRLVRAGLIAAGVAGGLALALAWLLSTRLLSPIKALTQAAQRMASGDLSQRVTARGGDEIASLAQTFNQMAASLQKAEQARRAMTADIAHELRTPIAVQRAYLEALQDGVYPLTPENLQPVIDSAELLTRLVEDLRTLALADAGELKLVKAPTNLGSLAARVLERFRPEAENRGIRLLLVDALAGQDGECPADAGRVEQILNNLLSNALRHTPEGGEVEIRVSRQDNWLVVSVADSGPGIAVEDLPRIFERFYRADKARSRQEGGTGLGLAIARQLALAHGGDLTAENRPQGGACFSLRLPVQPTPLSFR